MTRRDDSGAFKAELERLGISYPTCGAVSTAPAERWDDGSIVGNGIQGALAYCRTYNEEMVLSQEELFLPLFPFHGYLPIREHYETIRQLVIDDRVKDAQELLNKLKAEEDFPFYNTTDPFVGACALDLIMQEPLDHSSYVRSTNFETGESLVAWEDNSGIYHRQAYAAHITNRTQK